MDSFFTILAESIVGMGITVALLALLALIFRLIGKFGEKKVEKIRLEGNKRDDVGAILPFIAAAVYLYHLSERGKPTTAVPMKKREGHTMIVITSGGREEWRKSGRRDFMR